MKKLFIIVALAALVGVAGWAQTEVPIEKFVTFPDHYVGQSVETKGCWMLSDFIKKVDELKGVYIIVLANSGDSYSTYPSYGFGSPVALVDSATAEKILDYVIEVHAQGNQLGVNVYGRVKEVLLDGKPFQNLYVDKIETLNYDGDVTKTFTCTWK